MRFAMSVLILFFTLSALPQIAAEPLRIAVSLPVPGDWAREIGGGRVEVSVLAPPGADPHAWQPAPGDMLKLRRADLILAVSPELEGWFTGLVAAENLRKKTVWLAPGAGAAANVAGAAGADVKRDTAHRPPLTNSAGNDACGVGGDPHLWLDPELSVAMCGRLAKELARLDPKGAEAYAAAATRYIAGIRELDVWAREFLATVPSERRILLSRHDNLRRLAGRYGLRAEAALSGSASAESPDPSAWRLAMFIRRARKAGTPLFYDGDAPGALVETVTRDAKLPPPVRLYIETLYPAPHPASTYQGMFRENIRLVGNALGAVPPKHTPASSQCK